MSAIVIEEVFSVKNVLLHCICNTNIMHLVLGPANSLFVLKFIKNLNFKAERQICKTSICIAITAVRFLTVILIHQIKAKQSSVKKRCEILALLRNSPLLPITRQ